MTFRVKYCNVGGENTLGLLYRIHVFNFIYSLFMMAMGYVELTKAILGASDLIKNGHIAMFIFCMLSLILTHVVLSVYMCCPR
jgi:hypothetical protein